jgi:hypothetical protein
VDSHGSGNAFKPTPNATRRCNPSFAHIHTRGVGMRMQAVRRALATLQRHHNVPREALLVTTTVGPLGDAGAAVETTDELYQKVAAHVRPTDIVAHKHCMVRAATQRNPSAAPSLV